MPREALHKTAHEVIAGSQNPTGVFMGTCGLFGNYHWETGPTIGNPGEFYNATHRTRTDSTEVLSITGTGCLKARWRAGACALGYAAPVLALAAGVTAMLAN